MKRLALIAALLALATPVSAQFKGTGSDFGTLGFTSVKAVSASLACSYTPVTTGTQGTAYTGATPSASGGTPSYTFSETGTLPGGLSISSSTGVISGTPTANGSFPSIQVKVTDSASNTANCGSAFTLVIAPAYTAQTPTYGGSATFASGGGTTQFTATGVPAGSPAFIATRRVYLVAMGANDTGGATFTSVTINGSPATIHSSVINTTTGAYVLTYSAVVTSGSTVSTAINLSIAIGSAPIIFSYYFDNSLLTSTTPTSGSGNTGAGTTTSLVSSGYSQTISGFSIASGTSSAGFGSPALTGNTTDFTFGSAIIGGHLAPIASTGTGTTTLTSTSATDMVLAVDAWH